MQISKFAALLVSTIYIFISLCFDWQFFHGWWGSERLIDMEFSLEAFKTGSFSRSIGCVSKN